MNQTDFLIAGLGNPGLRYSATRHNVGFRVVDELAARHGIRVDRIRFKAHLGAGTIAGKRVILLKPQTYMNLSGEAVRPAMNYYKIPPERVLLISDDVTLPLGRLRIRKQGSDGGHNGLKSVLAHCGTDAVPRLKVGVGSPEFHEMADWVLSLFEGEDRNHIARVLPVAADALTAILTKGPDEAIGLYNGIRIE